MDIELIRPKQFQDRSRSYHLYVDGKKFIKVRPNSSQVISIPNHTKYIQAKIDWCSSRKYYFRDAKYKKLVVKNAITGGFLKALILPIYYITFGKNRYLTIQSEK